MVITGSVQNGVIVVKGDIVLPEGTDVTIICDPKPEPRPGEERHYVTFPLVDSDHPGTVDLTNERIAEIFAEEDAAS